MEYFDKQIDVLLTTLKVVQQHDQFGDSFYSTTEGKIYDKSELFALVRKILGIDKQCSQCNDWKFDFDLSKMDGSENYVCQSCAEEIISGNKTVLEK